MLMDEFTTNVMDGGSAAQRGFTFVNGHSHASSGDAKSTPKLPQDLSQLTVLSNRDDKNISEAHFTYLTNQLQLQLNHIKQLEYE